LALLLGLEGEWDVRALLLVVHPIAVYKEKKGHGKKFSF
jgi:hypothetical protein